MGTASVSNRLDKFEQCCRLATAQRAERSTASFAATRSQESTASFAATPASDLRSFADEASLHERVHRMESLLGVGQGAHSTSAGWHSTPTASIGEITAVGPIAL